MARHRKSQGKRQGTPRGKARQGKERCKGRDKKLGKVKTRQGRERVKAREEANKCKSKR